MCWIDLVGDVFTLAESKPGNTHFCFGHARTRRQGQCEQTHTDLSIETRKRDLSSMNFSLCLSSPIISTLVHFLLVASLLCPVCSSEMGNTPVANQTLKPQEEVHKMNIIRTRLQQINKPSVKTIQSPDGDVIDCVVSHQQPAFDHPMLKGHKPLDPPERPKGHNKRDILSENFQLWTMLGESCPEGTIPIRRTTEQDMLRASSVSRFGRKIRRRVRRDTNSNGHEHAVGYVSGEQYYGAKASINVWAPRVTNQDEFSLSQMWVISGSFGDDLNTIEAGWQVSPELYGDTYPRFFTYWTSDAYQATGCYNLLCSGFVQTNNRIAIGAAISPTSSYGGGQFDISLLIWKDPKHGNWWLEFGSGILVGYWPSFLFTHLRDHASMVQFGGEVVNSRQSGSHTSTQMGSGHFASEGFGKASYFRNMQVVDWDNNLVPLSNLRVLADHPNCYDIQGGINNVWGNYFYYGGPGRNVRCP
ncbi:hypothetical protein PHAVU_002G063400 [Phaseolus vulgaris]|uniref:Neprosin PEP catalytic domain-containing protein n=1 Tax=Phaseolus vulgaris TaxID=3885 RepID=V7CJ81_PHAVU|nr:hypothetical protein PHAVU_002G063400g [Phaseolus vulgaris]ESW29350.1 hypothetical protein PHAVU_002G063400g [Phaseolus vulgaris]